MGILQTAITSRTTPKGVTKLYPNIVSYKNIKSDDLIEYMVSNSSVSKSTVLAAIGALRQLFSNYVLNGHRVQIPQLGIFGVSAKTRAVVTLEECGADCVKKLKLQFKPNTMLRNACKSVKFQGIVKGDETLNIITK